MKAVCEATQSAGQFAECCWQSKVKEVLVNWSLWEVKYSNPTLYELDAFLENCFMKQNLIFH
jgi:hypothetical protein